jgi:hypothetical protein
MLPLGCHFVSLTSIWKLANFPRPAASELLETGGRLSR